MLEQLKDAIIEMEQLLKNCCLPVLQKSNTDISGEKASLTSIKNGSNEKIDVKEPSIRIDPYLRKIFTLPFSMKIENEKSAKEKWVGSDLFEYKLQVKNIPSRYSSKFFSEDEIVENLPLDDHKISVKFEHKGIKINNKLSNNESWNYSNPEQHSETFFESNAGNISISSEV